MHVDICVDGLSELWGVGTSASVAILTYVGRCQSLSWNLMLGLRGANAVWVQKLGGHIRLLEL